jgi:hypothetical protein
MAGWRTEAGAYLNPRDTQPFAPLLDLHRDLNPHCAVGAWLSSALSSPLSSATDTLKAHYSSPSRWLPRCTPSVADASNTDLDAPEVSEFDLHTVTVRGT